MHVNGKFTCKTAKLVKISKNTILQHQTPIFILFVFKMIYSTNRLITRRIKSSQNSTAVWNKAIIARLTI